MTDKPDPLQILVADAQQVNRDALAAILKAG